MPAELGGLGTAFGDFRLPPGSGRVFFIVFFTTFPLRFPRLVVGRWSYAAVAGPTKIGISLRRVGISLLTNRDFPTNK